MAGGGLVGGSIDPSTVDAKIAAAVDTVMAAIPQPATAAPPSVADSGSAGSVQRYALADHTHSGLVRATRLTVGPLTGGAALVTWTFSPAFPDGTVPICSAVAETTSGASLPYVVNLVAPASATSAQFIVFKASTTTLGGTLASLINAVISPFVAGSTGVVINAVARLPST